MDKVQLMNRICDEVVNGPDIDERGLERMHYDIPGYKLFARRNHITANAVFNGMKIHWHDEIEIIYVRSGHMKYRVNEHIVSLNKGEGIVVNSRQLHIMQSCDVDYDIDCVIFHPEMLCASEHIKKQYVEPVINTKMSEYMLFDMSLSGGRTIIDGIGKLVELAYIKDMEMEAQALLFSMWHAIYNMCCHQVVQETVGYDELQSMRTMLEYIYMHYADKITIADICKVGQIGKSVCTKMFTDYTNYSPIEFVRQFRVSKSMELLKNTSLSITEIAYEVGFNNASFYTETFKKLRGITPKEFRKSCGVNCDMEE